MADNSRLWQTDPASMRDVVLDREALESKLQDCTALERVWILALLDRNEAALREGLALLRESQDRFTPLLALAQVYQRSYRWHEAARLQEEALQLARTREREALVRHHIGRRLFDEARYRDAATEFEWASDLYRAAGHKELSGLSYQAMKRARQVHDHQAKIWDAAHPGRKRG
jgi:tetratricopeptide (TPR) repeat protein